MFARLACFASLVGLMTVAAWAQEPSATTPAAPGAGPGLTLPGLPTASPTGTAAAPATSGSPEFDAMLKKWDDLLDQMKQTQVDYKLAKPEERGPLVEKFKQLKLDGEKLQPEVLKAAEAGLAKDPKGTAFVTFLASFANGEYLRDNYEQALRISEKLIDAFNARKDVELFAKLVGNANIAANTYNIAVSSYVEQADTNEVVDIRALNAEIADIVTRQTTVLRTQIDALVADLEGEEA